MPKLWTETIETHRRQVRDAILDTAASLAAHQGPLSLTMSQIAEDTGIGRATLYKYFPDVEAILEAWHERHVAGHLDHLAAVRDEAGGPTERLEAVLQAYAIVHRDRGGHDGVHGPHVHELAAWVHRGEQFAGAQQQLHEMIRELVANAAATGEVRNDIAPDELARYCMHALEAASGLPSRAAVRRLAQVTLDGLRRPA